MVKPDLKQVKVLEERTGNLTEMGDSPTDNEEDSCRKFFINKEMALANNPRKLES